MVSERRPDNAVSTLAYDAMNRAVSVKDAKSQTTTMAYDAMDNLLKLTDARGSVTQFAYDFEGRLAQVSSPEGVINYGYDLVDWEDHVCNCGAANCLGYMVAVEHIETIKAKLAEKDATAGTALAKVESAPE